MTPKQHPSRLVIVLAARGISDEHAERLITTIDRFGGIRVGDGVGPVLALFGSVRRALRCAAVIVAPVDGVQPSVALVAGEVTDGVPVQSHNVLDVADATARIGIPGQIVVCSGVQSIGASEDRFEFHALSRSTFAADGLTRAVFEARPLRKAGSAHVRGIFVGRNPELEVITSIIRTSRRRGVVVVAIAGEAGIGKTRLMEEAARAVGRDDQMVAWGRALDGASAPALWPWISVIRSLAGEPALRPALTSLGPTLSTLARVVPELNRQPATATSGAPTPSIGEGSRIELLLAIVAFLREAARRRPVVLVLDDLHWADAASLEMLAFVAAELRDAPVTIVIAYRDGDQRSGAPLRDALAEIARSGKLTPVHLEGLDIASVSSYLDLAFDEPPPDELSRAMRDRTDGNPFFIGESVKLLLSRSHGLSAATEIPETVKAVLRARLAALPAGSDQVLTTAAMIGRGFSFELLSEATGEPASALVDVLEQALALQVITEDGPDAHYRFHHALVQEALLENVSRTHQISLHHRVGVAMERLGLDHGDHAAAIAAHFERCAAFDHACRGKGAAYLVAAAEQASSRYAWRDAMDLYQRALSLVEGRDEMEDHKPATLLGLGRSAVLAAEWRIAWKALMQGYALARERGDVILAARAALLAAEVPADERRLVPLLDEAIEALGDADPALGRQLVVAMYYVAVRFWMGDIDELIGPHAPRRRAQFAEALRDTSDPRTRVRALAASAWDAERSAQYARALALFRETHQRAAELGELRIEIESLLRVGYSLLFQGRIGDAEAAFQEAREFALARRANQEADLALTILGAIAMMRGRFSELGAIAAEIVPQNFWHELYPACIGEVTCDRERAVAALPSGHWSGSSAMRALLIGGRTRVLWNCGRPIEARREFSEWLAITGGGQWPVRPDTLADIDDAVDILDNEQAARLLSALNMGERPRTTAHGRGCDHLRGDLAFRLGRVAVAGQHYQEGLSWATREGIPVEAARCLAGLARIEEQRGNISTARRLLTRATDLLRPLGTTIYAERVRRALNRLASAPYPSSARPERGLDLLSERERQVLRLLASGSTNREIGAALVISGATVARHVSNILAKLGLDNRTEAAAYAVAHGLTAAD
jgi:DNA-binding CsgD family transcriptional regulator